MAQEKRQIVQYLADYRPYPFILSETRLDFTLVPDATRVKAILSFAPRDSGQSQDLVLDGGEEVKLISLTIDGHEPDPAHVTRQDETLTIAATALPDAPFTVETEVEINPMANTTFEGLYMSGGMFCTQCEAQGFRHITFYPDRPDVMTTFRVGIHSDQNVLLSNGNLIGQKECGTEWYDPWPKPSYLFALVAGNLVAISDSFTTLSGRKVDLNVWVRPGDEDRADFAMESLIRSMKWDEEAYGREYDLEVFNIVAVDDFNMGAMENKGLNIFNSKLVLASPETATDGDYERIEGVIGHEYFHNWTGNRITCRDWFQLCLKEGLTVFRDQQFTSDMRSAPVKRIMDVQTLRARQFREDAGPLAHPPRPDHYEEINNFYTATVYEKGAEVIGMLKRLIGDDSYRQALDLYFDRHDGDAATIEDWLNVFQDATGRDLTQFKHWYTDAGTPHLNMVEEWSETTAGGTLTLTFTQNTPPTPGQPDKPARVIPIAVGLIGPNGDEVLPTQILEMTQASQGFSFEGLGARPVVSALRDFSAPVILTRNIDDDTRAFLLANDPNPFARWEAGRELAIAALVALSQGQPGGDSYVKAIGQLIADDDADPAFRALCLNLPGDEEIATRLSTLGIEPDPDAIYQARQDLARRIAETHQDLLARIYDSMQVSGAYSPDAEPSAKRALRIAALSLLNRIDGGERAEILFGTATNMTERMAALTCLIRRGRGQTALQILLEQFGDNRLVMDKWFSVQPMAAPPESAVATARELAQRSDFDWKNPNRYRALIGGLSANHAAFHARDGSGYNFVAEWIMKMDPVNPQIAARMSSVFETWPRYDTVRRAKALVALEQIAAVAGLSRNTREMVSRMIAAGA
ncbi:aminopeptidase N [Paracoccus sp. 11-3]|uniref:Aminopeptidase N n=1 Tax=Paracoccus amoyensis TaxID=2760093 RepID=A0A926J571_9RHOB|nr:aminopeptidase N [Paracoccus amoyensis]MBC9245917.1 aminopeptidase N [Paracoccus amoyensis]